MEELDIRFDIKSQNEAHSIKELLLCYNIEITGMKITENSVSYKIKGNKLNELVASVSNKLSEYKPVYEIRFLPQEQQPLDINQITAEFTSKPDADDTTHSYHPVKQTGNNANIYYKLREGVQNALMNTNKRKYQENKDDAFLSCMQGRFLLLAFYAMLVIIILLSLI